MHSPWLTIAIVKCIQKKHDWSRELKQNLITCRSYCEYRDKVRNSLKIAQDESYSSKLKSLNNDHKMSWRVLNNLLTKPKNDNQSYFFIKVDIVNNEETVYKFLDHFVKKINSRCLTRNQ